MDTVNTQQVTENARGDVNAVMIGAIVGGVLGLVLIGGIIAAIVIASNRRSRRQSNPNDQKPPKSEYAVVPNLQDKNYDFGDISLKE